MLVKYSSHCDIKEMNSNKELPKTNSPRKSVTRSKYASNKRFRIKNKINTSRKALVTSKRNEVNLEKNQKTPYIPVRASVSKGSSKINNDIIVLSGSDLNNDQDVVSKHISQNITCNQGDTDANLNTNDNEGVNTSNNGSSNQRVNNKKHDTPAHTAPARKHSPRSDGERVPPKACKDSHVRACRSAREHRALVKQPNARDETQLGAPQPPGTLDRVTHLHLQNRNIEQLVRIYASHKVR